MADHPIPRHLYENAIANIDCAIDAVDDAIENRAAAGQTPDEGLVWARRILDFERSNSNGKETR